ncbi:MAG: FG-GAP repeat protein [Phycisphaerales bacterium]|nr:FG-GAP repeat protein [Phycisphaerales bacterium]
MHHPTDRRFRPDSVLIAVAVVAAALVFGAATGRACAADCNSNGIEDAVELSPGEQIAKLVANDASIDANFGNSVAMDGDTAIIGAWRDDENGSFSGAAYVFRDNGGSWQQVAKLTADDAVENNFFGVSVAISGNTVVVGAYGSADPLSLVGSAYVFREQNNSWQQIAKLTADDGADHDYFGIGSTGGIAITGDMIVIGAVGDQDNGLWSGSAYVFREIQGVWQQTTKLTSNDALANDFFGATVALSGGTVIIGAYGSGGTNNGASYVFREINGDWQQIGKLSDANPAAEGRFGWSVAISEDTAIVGSPESNENANGSGVTYVFREIEGAWQRIAKLVAADGEAFDWFGASVAINGNIAIIGAPGRDNGDLDFGAAYVFREDGGVWRQIATFTAADGTSDDDFGNNVAMAGNIAVFGVPSHGDGLLNRSGAAYVFKIPRTDCNANGVLDECDVASATSADCNSNGVPDECEADCNSNGIPDECDFAELTSTDCNLNGLPDECELIGNDCNSNDYPDECDIAGLTSSDCNRNNVPDECEPPTADCNVNGVPDVCEYQLTISGQKIISIDADGANAVYTSDLDGDGDLDVLSASNADDKIAWYENIDGAGTFGPQRIISSTAAGANSVFAADLDGDGDADVISSSSSDRKIAWYENIDGLGAFGLPTVFEIGLDTPISVIAADLDGDLDLDILFATRGFANVAWFENTDGLGAFGPIEIIDDFSGLVSSAIPADLDGDGDLDVLATLDFDDTVLWYENTDGLGTFDYWQVITTVANGALSAFAADLDGDGDLDVLSASKLDSKIAFYENTDGLGSFGPQQIISTDMDRPASVSARDLDGDGDLDVLSASSGDDKIAWYENTGGLGQFGAQQVITVAADGAKSVITADLDGDGDFDVLSVSPDDDKIAWYEVETVNDCNNNDVHDECDIAGATSLDCNNNAVPDECELVLNDCNMNGVPDDCDVEQAASLDCDGNGVPDECQPDCNLNGVADACDIAGMNSDDCNTNHVPDECEPDCNGNGVADGCDIAAGSASDCDNNGTLDECDIAEGTAIDCNGNGTPDQCELNMVSSDQNVLSTTADAATSVYAADIDGDGDADVLAAAYGDDEITWYENIDGLGTLGAQQILADDADHVRAVLTADMDGDGDADVLSASRPVAWYENLDGLGTFGPERPIATMTSYTTANSIFAVDMDGDGDTDVLAGMDVDCRLVWYENSDGLGNFGLPHYIDADLCALSVFAADLDGDGDADVLAGPSGYNVVSWYENTDGAGSFGPPQPLHSSGYGARSVFAVDVDGDDDFDVLSILIGNDSITWHENLDGQANFGVEQVITNVAGSATSLFAIDLDSDGDADVLSASGLHDEIVWYQNNDGMGEFGAAQLVASNVLLPSSVFAADLDGDGDLDALSASQNDDKIAWYKNSTINDCNNNKVPDDCDIASGTSTDFNQNSVPDECEDCNMNHILDYLELVNNDCNSNGIPDECDEAVSESKDCNNNGIFDGCEIAGGSADDCNANLVPDECELQGVFSADEVITAAANGAFAVIATDIDGDGDADVLSASANNPNIAWYKNTDGLGIFDSQHPISDSGTGVSSIDSADLDGDGDVDVLLATGSIFSSFVSWYENTDGLGEFGPRNVISSGVHREHSASAADLDGDGDADVLSGSWNDLAWRENTDGLGTFGPRTVISDLVTNVVSVVSADLDGDGDFDVISVSSNDGKVAWYQNIDGLGSFGPQQLIAGPVTVRSIRTADLDGDGDADVLYARSSSVAWHENTDGLGTFGPSQLVGEGAQTARSVFAIDLDGDGDIDVLSASSGDDKIAWYENTDGLANFGPQQIISTSADGARSVFAADLDGDGDADVLSASYDDDTIAWYANIGYDCNRNRVPDDCEIDTDGDGLIDGCDRCAGGMASGDRDGNGIIDLADFTGLEPCLVGPESDLNEGCECFDFDLDGDNDLNDFAVFQAIFVP